MLKLQHKLFFLIGFLMTLLLTSSWLQGEEPISPQPSSSMDHTQHVQPPPQPSSSMETGDHTQHVQPPTATQEHDHAEMSMPASDKTSSGGGHEQHGSSGSDPMMMHQMMMKRHHAMAEHFDRLLPAVEHPQYLKECGSCHYPYQPALLPSRSWERLLNELSNHFGDDAQLEEAILNPIRAYLIEHAADKIGFGRPEIFALSIPSHEAPLRITETRYFRELHESVPSHYATSNPRVRSWSQCGACHKEAQQGFFNSQEVSIPGVSKQGGMGMMGGKMGKKMNMK